ncbi:hypothetical protein DFH09DRAFT_1437891 [Mycena vulgaris]|nr:hypothetical protein DFH09DRAFT_1437891 [Mycena vulgaris]
MGGRIDAACACAWGGGRGVKGRGCMRGEECECALDHHLRDSPGRRVDGSEGEGDGRVKTATVSSSRGPLPQRRRRGLLLACRARGAAFGGRRLLQRAEIGWAEADRRCRRALASRREKGEGGEDAEGRESGSGEMPGDMRCGDSAHPPLQDEVSIRGGGRGMYGDAESMVDSSAASLRLEVAPQGLELSRDVRETRCTRRRQAQRAGIHGKEDEASTETSKPGTNVDEKRERDGTCLAASLSYTSF